MTRGPISIYIAVLALGACAAENPAFSGDGTTAGAGDDGETGGGDVGTTRPQGTTGGASADSLDDGATTRSTMEATTVNGGDGIDRRDLGVSSCEAAMLPPIPLTLEVSDRMTADECPIFMRSGALAHADGLVAVLECPGNCPVLCDGPEAVVTIGLPGAGPLQALPACGTLIVWGRDDDDACIREGLAVLDEDGLPVFILSETLGIPPAVAGGTPVTLADRVPCDGACTDPFPPGEYALQFGDVGLVMQGAVAEPLSPLFARYGAVAGFVTNRTSLVTDTCEVRSSWTFER